jgi:type IV secretory pathway VirB2 component (pilin)
MPKANTLSLLSKIIAAVIIVVACILSMTGVYVDMPQIIAGCGFLSATFLSVDISKIKTSGHSGAATVYEEVE